MHIIIAVISAAAGLIWALHSLQNAGVDLNAFNPFTWMRRRQWEKKLGTKPMHALTESMDVAALLVVAMAKEHGDITRDTKHDILNMFESEFGISRSRAIEMFSASAYMISDAMDMSNEVRHVLNPSKDQFQPSHIEKLMAMLTKVAKIEGEPTEGQRKLLQAVQQEFSSKDEPPKNW